MRAQPEPSVYSHRAAAYCQKQVQNAGFMIDGKLVLSQLSILWANRFQFPKFFLPHQPDHLPCSENGRVSCKRPKRYVELRMEHDGLGQPNMHFFHLI